MGEGGSERKKSEWDERSVEGGGIDQRWMDGREGRNMADG